MILIIFCTHRREVLFIHIQVHNFFKHLFKHVLMNFLLHQEQKIRIELFFMKSKFISYFQAPQRLRVNLVHLFLVWVLILHKSYQLRICIVVSQRSEFLHFSFYVKQVIHGSSIFVFFREENPYNGLSQLRIEDIFEEFLQFSPR